MSYQLSSYVNRQEAEALKEMIFKRVRERANAMTNDVQADVMNIARESFVSKNNPFSQILTQTAETQAPTVQEPVKAEAPEVKSSALHEFVEAAEEAANQVGFPQKNLFAGAANQNRIIKEQAAASQIQSTMIEARAGLSNRKSFMGALEFLNSQAAASLLNKRVGRGIDMVV